MPRPPVPPVPYETKSLSSPAQFHATEEARVDLEDGLAKTLAEIHADWADWYSVAEINEYWAKRCRPLSSFRGAGRDKAQQKRSPKATDQPEARQQMLDPILAWGVPRSEVDEQCEPGPLVREANGGYQWQDGRGRWHKFGAFGAAAISKALAQGHLSALVSLDTGRKYTVSLSPLWRSAALADSQDAPSASDCLGLADSRDQNSVNDGLPAASDSASTSGAGAEGRETRHTLKVSLNSEMRRFAVTWPSDLCSKEVLAIMRGAVLDGFGPALALEGFILRYLDGDGDVCTLVEGTLCDCLSFARGGVLRLQLVAVSDCVVSGTSTPADAGSASGAPSDLSPPVARSPALPASVMSGQRAAFAPPESIHEEYDRDWGFVKVGGGSGVQSEAEDS